jgi:hypothetical protein
MKALPVFCYRMIPCRLMTTRRLSSEDRNRDRRSYSIETADTKAKTEFFAILLRCWGNDTSYSKKPKSSSTLWERHTSQLCRYYQKHVTFKYEIVGAMNIHAGINKSIGIILTFTTSSLSHTKHRCINIWPITTPENATSNHVSSRTQVSNITK